MIKPIDRLYEFGSFRLDTVNKTLLRNGKALQLNPKAYEMLLLFVLNSERLIDKEEILKTLWQDNFVDEANISQTVYTLRKILGEGKNGKQFIETVPKRGYRFIQPVRIVEYDAESNDHPPSGTQPFESETVLPQTVIENTLPKDRTNQEIDAQRINSTFFNLINLFRRKRLITVSLSLLLIAVVIIVYFIFRQQSKSSLSLQVKSIVIVPFKTLSVNKDDESLSLGITETLKSRLGNYKELRVRLSNRSRHNDEAGKETFFSDNGQQGDWALEGSIQKQGNRLRVSVDLWDSKTDVLIWSNQFEDELQRLFELQDTIFIQVLKGLALPINANTNYLIRNKPTDDIDAYQAYLKGRYHLYQFSKEGQRKAVEYFNQSIALDNQFALAYAGLAETYFYLTDVEYSGLTAGERAKAACAQALTLDPSLAEAHTAQALIYLRFDWNWEGADTEFQRAIQLKPHDAYIHDWYGWYLTQMGRLDEALPELQQAQALDPPAFNIQTDIAIFYYGARQFDRAVSEFEKMLTADPNYFPARYDLAWTYLAMGKRQEAINELLKVYDADTRLQRLSALAIAYAANGQKDEARKLLNQLLAQKDQQYVAPFELGIIYAGLDDLDSAYRYFNKACDERSGWIIFLKHDPLFDNLRNDPRFVTLLARVGLS